MELEVALHILASVHTGADPLTGFVVRMGALPNHFNWSQRDYIEAWKAVRKHIHLQTEVGDYNDK